MSDAPTQSHTFDTEEGLAAAAGVAARRWSDLRLSPLLVALRGDLGSGKTAWARAMLRGLGYTGRVPSPTYTLVERYTVEGLDVIHLDLYRLAGETELENLGLRDWLDGPNVWLLVEWPERAPAVEALADLVLTFEIVDATTRRMESDARTARGRAAIAELSDFLSSNAR